jgi:hypothetical protein
MLFLTKIDTLRNGDSFLVNMSARRRGGAFEIRGQFFGLKGLIITARGNALGTRGHQSTKP